jgi:hypothetical protein
LTLFLAIAFLFLFAGRVALFFFRRYIEIVTR